MLTVIYYLGLEGEGGQFSIIDVIYILKMISV